MIKNLLAIGLAAVLACPAAMAEGPKPFPQFEAKRIKAPRAGQKPRIDVQIDPAAEPAAIQAAAPASAPASSPEGRYAWFWDRVSPDISGSGPGRLASAMGALAAESSRVAAPRMQQMQDIAQANGIDILRSTIGTQVSPALVLAVISVESAGNPTAISKAGAQGLMQLMPDTAQRFGVSDSLAAPENIAGGVKYLDWLMQEFDRDPILVLAGYNAGEGSVRKHAGVPPFAETRDYVPKVLAAFQVARGLCKTPPELISDGCVFSVMN